MIDRFREGFRYAYAGVRTTRVDPAIVLRED